LQGVRDPLGGINSLWPLFGISNQLLGAIALCVATTVLMKTHRARFIWITTIPLVCLVSITFSAGWQKIFASDPRLGFLSHASGLEAAMASGKIAAAKLAATQTLIFNDRLDAAVCGVFLLLVTVIIGDSLRVWYRFLRGSQEARSSETPFVPSQLEVEV
jgi:carbon starvation protein